MEIDQASPEHPYRQLATRLREQIRSGEIVAQFNRRRIARFPILLQTTFEDAVDGEDAAVNRREINEWFKGRTATSRAKRAVDLARLVV